MVLTLTTAYYVENLMMHVEMKNRNEIAKKRIIHIVTNGGPANSKVDIVYLWANSSDTAYQRLRWSFEKEYGKASSSWANTQDNGELLLSMRAVFKFLPRSWLGNVYLVTTQGQRPQWLNPEHSQIHIVSDAEILGNASFNSHALYSRLHRIPGIARYFV
eukprot:CAMPEP_0202723900 /NCGR_PEP_ID=MMETSP1385-20130828/169291_1 /ASSEMBLY_ACC=CAM_ASM_000861 /TAXON_ID=933848 /ORGANISM="Elphidium margaritaceum" /LENGTH=159 /DNA_ID=CAMNT_0049389279 /DNA_START=17 /DNA_END=492 /DNA_ORIENTATION=-